MINREIAGQTGLSRSTILNYLKTDAFPERRRYSTKGSLLDRFLPYLHQRFGRRDAAMLNSYGVKSKNKANSGTKRIVFHYIARLRVLGVEAPQTPKINSVDNKTTVFKTPSAKRADWWLLQSPEDLQPEQKAFLEQFIDLSPEAPKIQEMGRRFRAMIRERIEPNFDEWMETGQASEIKELKNFVQGIKQDRAAVKVSLIYE